MPLDFFGWVCYTEAKSVKYRSFCVVSLKGVGDYENEFAENRTPSGGFCLLNPCTDRRNEMNQITLQKIDENNFLDAFHLELKAGQERFVSHPIRSLAQAYVYYHQCTPFGIFAEGKMVGYVMVIYDYDLMEYNIWHMMIDKGCQGCGYGKAALQRCLEYIGQKPFGDSNRVVLTCHRENAAAMALYRQVGFAETGNEDEDEVELALALGGAV